MVIYISAAMPSCSDGCTLFQAMGNKCRCFCKQSLNPEVVTVGSKWSGSILVFVAWSWPLIRQPDQRRIAGLLPERMSSQEFLWIYVGSDILKWRQVCGCVSGRVQTFARDGSCLD